MFAYHFRSSIVGNGSTADSLYYIWSCFLVSASKVPEVNKNTVKRFFVILNWSLYWLNLGRWPTHHWDGTAYLPGTAAYNLAYNVRYLADGYYGIPLALIGDLDYFYKWLELENHSSTTAPCMCCAANLTTFNWRDCRTVAAWIGSTYTHATWVAAHPNRLSLFFLSFITIYCLCPDYMHCKYLGCDQYLMGSILWYMCQKLMEDPDPSVNMARIMVLLKRQFRQRDVSSFGIITINMFSNKDSKKLRGRASEIRHLGCSLLAVFKAEHTAAAARGPLPTDEQELCRLIKATLKLNTKLDEIIDENPGWTITGTPHDQLVQCAHDFATTYSALSRQAATMELELFTMTIKMHYIIHICRFADRLHPKLTWCFGGETFMKVARGLMQSCMRASSPYDATRQFGEKYPYALHCLFKKISKE